MANAEQVTKLNEGVEAWNLWRTSHELIPDLSGAVLAGKDLTGADLRSVNFENANLEGAVLGYGTMLRDAKFYHANLSHADVRGADLQDAHFAGADLRGASLRETNLLGADLRETVGGLRTEQYAGADLTGAKLPEPLSKLYDSLESVKGISESARKIFLVVLAACLYCWLTIVTTTDVNLVTNRNSSPLPIIQTPIPIVGFYLVAPLLILCVYFYFHFYLQKLWEELGSLPAIFPDGRPLHRKVDPWLLNDLVSSHLPKLNVDRPFLSHFQMWISVLLSWWVVPITMLLFWEHYLRRHEGVGTTFHILLLVTSVGSALSLYFLAVATLRGGPRRPFGRKILPSGRQEYFVLVSALALLIFLSWTSWEIRWGEPSSAVARTFFLFGDYLPGVNLDGADISQRTSVQDTSGRSSVIIGARLPKANLRWALAPGAFFAGADLNNADLSHGVFASADFTGADLKFAKLRFTFLTRAQLTNARLDFVDLSNANLQRSCLRGANLTEAHLDQADLEYADLRNARHLYSEDLKRAFHWNRAFYDDDMLKALKLPPDHNEVLSRQLKDETKFQEDNGAGPLPNDPCQKGQ